MYQHIYMKSGSLQIAIGLSGFIELPGDIMGNLAIDYFGRKKTILGLYFR